MKKIIIKFLTLLSFIFFRMPNLDIIYDVTIAVTWNEINTNRQVINQPTCLPSFVTFNAFYFSLWPRTLSFLGNGRKSPSKGPPRTCSGRQASDLNISVRESDLIRPLILSNNGRGRPQHAGEKWDTWPERGNTFRQNDQTQLIPCKNYIK